MSGGGVEAMMRELAIGVCRYRVFHDAQYLDITFPDGLMATATPNGRPSDLQRASELGFAHEWRACVFHEIAHTLVSLRMGRAWSYTLRGAALKRAGQGDYYPEWADEEQVVFAFTRAYMLGSVEAWLPERIGDVSAACREMRGYLETAE